MNGPIYDRNRTSPSEFSRELYGLTWNGCYFARCPCGLRVLLTPGIDKIRWWTDADERGTRNILNRSACSSIRDLYTKQTIFDALPVYLSFKRISRTSVRRSLYLQNRRPVKHAERSTMNNWLTKESSNAWNEVTWTMFRASNSFRLLLDEGRIPSCFVQRDSVSRQTSIKCHTRAIQCASSLRDYLFSRDDIFLLYVLVRKQALWRNSRNF